MFIRMHAGRYAGEVKDIEFTSARSLIEAGLAEVAYADQLAPEVRSERIESVETSAAAAVEEPKPKLASIAGKKKR